MSSRTFVSLFIAFASLTLALHADELPPSDGPIQVPEKKFDSPKEPTKRDPTIPSKRLDEILNPPKALGPSGKAEIPALPKVVLKGRVIGPSRGPAAILEIDGQLKMISEGGEISADSGLTIRVVELSKQRIRLEVVQLKQFLTLP